MEIKHKTDGKKGAFLLEKDGRQIGEMTYVFAGEHKFIIDHTQIEPGHEGEGLGKLLVNAAVGMAREKGLKIEPVCPYARHILTKSEGYADVLA